MMQTIFNYMAMVARGVRLGFSSVLDFRVMVSTISGFRLRVWGC